MHDQRLAAYFFLQGTGSHREVNHELSSIVVFGSLWRLPGNVRELISHTAALGIQWMLLLEWEFTCKRLKCHALHKTHRWWDLYPDCIKALLSEPRRTTPVSAVLWSDRSDVSRTLLSPTEDLTTERRHPKVSCQHQQGAANPSQRSLLKRNTSSNSAKKAQEKRLKCTVPLRGISAGCVCCASLWWLLTVVQLYNSRVHFNQFSPAYCCTSQTGICVQLLSEAIPLQNSLTSHISSWKMNMLSCVMSRVTHLNE